MSEYRLSRCVEQANAPQQWHWAAIDGDRSVVQRELLAAVKPHVPTGAWPEVRADIKVYIERIEACQAVDPEDIQNISRDRDLFEVRLQLDTWSLVVRIYTTEPRHMPHDVIALLAHRKVVDVAANKIADLQDAEIDEASRRLTAGRVIRWGVL